MDKPIYYRKIIYVVVNIADVAIVTGPCKYEKIHKYPLIETLLNVLSYNYGFLCGRFTEIS